LPASTRPYLHHATPAPTPPQRRYSRRTWASKQSSDFADL